LRTFLVAGTHVHVAWRQHSESDGSLEALTQIGAIVCALRPDTAS